MAGWPVNWTSQEMGRFKGRRRQMIGKQPWRAWRKFSPPPGLDIKSHCEQFWGRTQRAVELYSLKRVIRNQYCQRGKKMKEVFNDVEDPRGFVNAREHRGCDSRAQSRGG